MSTSPFLLHPLLIIRAALPHALLPAMHHPLASVHALTHALSAHHALLTMHHPLAAVTLAHHAGSHALPLSATLPTPWTKPALALRTISLALAGTLLLSQNHSPCNN
ncbi:MAG: hypothetical protein KGY41_07465 [Desulfovermiculus sp.]|nr:hypothetical protein [Desulfovermiculus sp.]